VLEWHDDERWGLIERPDLDGPCWVHFSSLAMDGFHRLEPGARVRAHVETVAQDGYRYRATDVIVL
jgi:CspA family cold shock protein